jgi:hypothetical protein
MPQTEAPDTQIHQVSPAVIESPVQSLTTLEATSTSIATFTPAATLTSTAALQSSPTNPPPAQASPTVQAPAQTTATNPLPAQATATQVVLPTNTPIPPPSQTDIEAEIGFLGKQVTSATITLNISVYNYGVMVFNLYYSDVLIMAPNGSPIYPSVIQPALPYRFDSGATLNYTRKCLIIISTVVFIEFIHDITLIQRLLK